VLSANLAIWINQLKSEKKNSVNDLQITTNDIHVKIIKG
jgi:hypothetical protein